MKSNIIPLSLPEKNVIAPLLATSIVVFILFFVDEGYYDLRWMKDPGNWFVFLIYFVIILPVQLLISEWLLKRVAAKKKTLLMILVSAPLTTVFLMVLFSQA